LWLLFVHLFGHTYLGDTHVKAVGALNQRVCRQLESAQRCLDNGDFEGAQEYYKSALRETRDVLGTCHLRIAELFELLEEVHKARGKIPKCRAIRRRVEKIRALCEAECCCNKATKQKCDSHFGKSANQFKENP
jgi:hypothetical protein